MRGVSLDTVLAKFSNNTENPTNFLGVSQNVADSLKSSTKELYEFTKYEETKANLKKSRKSLENLIVQNFDLEQIWQQIELQNDDAIDTAVRDLSNLLVVKSTLIFKSVNDDLTTEIHRNTDSNNVDIDSCSHDSSSNSDSDENLDNKELRRDQINSDAKSSEGSNTETEDEGQELSDGLKHARQKQKGSVVDDAFFKLNEMEEFLEKEENPKKPKDSGLESEEGEDEEGSVDLFKEDSEDDSGDEAKTARFKDYFVAKEENTPKRKVNKLMEELEDDNSGSELEENEALYDELKSTLELRQERLKRKIEDLENQAISEKPWQLKGEVRAENRPQNSLLEEIVEFDLSSRPAPIITEQTSLQLEDIIRQRIKNKTFDSVEKISRPVETPLEYKKKLVLDQEKSKESLAKIYEKEFLEQQSALDKDKMDTEEVEPEIHKELKKLMRNLFTKLDALSNFHFTSTPAIPELKIVSNLPAVNMEEVAPVAASEATLLAPEEIRNKTKGDIIGKQEKTSTDKKRERRKKKLKQKIHSKRKAKAENNPTKKHRVKA